MMIVYINGYGGENSKKGSIIKNYFSKYKNIEAISLNIDYDNFDEEKIDSFFHQNHDDIVFIVASSTGAYIGKYYAYRYNIHIVYLNPVVDYKETLKNRLRVDIKFNDKYNVKTLWSKPQTLILCKDDELIDYKETLKVLNIDDVVLLEKGGHRMENFEEDVLCLIEESISKSSTGLFLEKK